MKKVLFFVPEFPVLSETFIQGEIAALAQLGNLDVTVCTLKKGKGEITPILNDRINYLSITSKDILNGFFSTIANLLGIYYSLGITLSNKNRGFFGNLYLWIKSFGFAYKFSKFNPDHIHVHFLSEPSTIVLNVSLLLNIPFSISAHARDVFGNSKDVVLNSELIKSKAFYSKFIVLCNKKAYDYVLAEVFPKDRYKVKLNYHGINIEKIEHMSFDLSLKPSKPFIYTFGRIVEKKGLIYLVEAADILSKRGVDFCVKIGGTGDFVESLKANVAKRNLTAVFEFIGDKDGIPHGLALNYLKVCDVFVLPSIDLPDGDAEGVPNTLVEAALFAKPVITTDAGSIGEIVNSDTSIIVKQKDALALAESIEKLLKDPQLSSQLGNTFSKVIKEKFDINKNILALQELLK